MKYTGLVLAVAGWCCCSGLARGTTTAATAEPAWNGAIVLQVPTLRTNLPVVDDAYRIALGDLVGNVQPWQHGLLKTPAPAVLAGLDYGRPWTRDAAINASNGASLIMPDVARNTLLSVLEQTAGKVRIGGQYWDCIVWTMGSWQHYLDTGDQQFLALALTATRNSLAYFEKTEFDPKDHLFRGPGWSDGRFPVRWASRPSMHQWQTFDW